MNRAKFVCFAVIAGLAGASYGCSSSGACAEGATKEAETGVCVKLPAEYKMDKAQKSGESSMIRVHNDKTLDSFTIWVEKPDDLDKRAKVVANMAGDDNKLVANGDTSPAKGKFFHFHHPDSNRDFAVALVPGKQHFYRCEIQNTEPKAAATELDICKTVSGP